MPLNKDIKKVLVIGSGPIVIGQAAEFDYEALSRLETVMAQRGRKQRRAAIYWTNFLSSTGCFTSKEPS